MPFTPYMDRCLQDLETGNECRTDPYLVQLVRIQHLAGRIAQSYEAEEEEHLKTE